MAAVIQAWFFTKAKAIREGLRTESCGKGRGHPEYGKRENRSQDFMGDGGRLSMKIGYLGKEGLAEPYNLILNLL